MDNSKFDSELIELLNNVSDSYPDFVHGAALAAKQTNTRDELVEFIRDNPEADTSDIIEYQISLSNQNTE